MKYNLWVSWFLGGGGGGKADVWKRGRVCMCVRIGVCVPAGGCIVGRAVPHVGGRDAGTGLWAAALRPPLRWPPCQIWGCEKESHGSPVELGFATL